MCPFYVRPLLPVACSVSILTPSVFRMCTFYIFFYIRPLLHVVSLMPVLCCVGNVRMLTTYTVCVVLTMCAVCCVEDVYCVCCADDVLC